jgi:glycosyltransferase involved in cell wall biosynthesis
MENSLIALLGRSETPTDGVEDYCKFLGEALSRRDVKLEIRRVRWNELGWIAALRQLRRESTDWRASWVVMQYTALAWSRRGFPFGALFALSVLRRGGIRCGVVFHEPCRQEGKRWIGGLRGLCQDWVVRRLYAGATKAIFLDPLEKIRWLPANTPNAHKAWFIPIGANLPDASPGDAAASVQSGDVKTVVVFCLSGPSNRQREINDIAHAMRVVTRRGVRARVIFAGRGTAEARTEIDAAFASVSAEVIQLGLKDATELRKILSAADAMLCVRGRLYMRRGSAIAGIACGLPIVGYEGEAEGTPLEEAGIELVPYRDCEALGKALTTILTDSEKRKLLSSRSSQAQQKFFSWTQIANRYAGAFNVSQRVIVGSPVRFRDVTQPPRSRTTRWE